MPPPSISEDEVEDFLARVDGISKTLDGLNDGTISVEDLDRMERQKELLAARQEREAKEAEESSAKRKEELESRRDAAKVKVDEIMERKIKKDKARERFVDYEKTDKKSSFITTSTDYTGWDLWCPSDEEDDLIKTLPPSTDPAFKAMEKDMDDRHERMKQKIKTATKLREAGNKSYRAGQYMEAYKNYEAGLDADKRVIELQANAAMAALKVKMPVQAIEHCDQVFRLADFFLERPKHPLVFKAYLRRAEAHKMLKHYEYCVRDLEEAVKFDPADKEAKKLLEAAKKDLAEHMRMQGLVANTSALQTVGNTEAQDPSQLPAAPVDISSASLQALGRIEKLVKVIIPEEASSEAETAAGNKENVDTEVEPTEATKSSKADASTRATAIAGACGELKELLETEEDHRIYLRGCGGMDAMMKQLLANEGSTAMVLRALGSACRNDRNQVHLYQDKVVVVRVMKAMEHTELEVRQAAAALMHTCSSCEAARKVMATELRSRRQLLRAMIAALTVDDAALQANTVGMLSNCALEGALRIALREEAEKGEGGDVLSKVLGLLKSPLDFVQERAATLFGNLCADKQLLEGLAKEESAVAALVEALPGAADPLATKAPAGMAGMGLGGKASEKKAGAKKQGGRAEAKDSAHVAAVLAALANCMLNPAAQAKVASKGGVRRLINLLEHESLLVAGRAAAALARASKPAEGMRETLKRGGVGALVELLHRTGRISDIVKSDEEEAEMRSAVMDSAVRAVAGCTAASAEAATQVVGDASASEGAVGNAALSIADTVKHDAGLAALLESDVEPVPPLIQAAHKRTGAAQKNAAIALARMARHPALLDQIRKLNGIEIIYAYVKP
eukprot:gene3796-4750_t